ncbi:MAG TPA: cupin-like domain-containing protein [Bryobacteraceae bacterium]|nr:cupin-like domain-containing protein [Bryobacteraceae bacterium]
MTNTVVPAQWINWIAENRTRGVPERALFDIMVSNGFDAPTARRHVSQQAASASADKLECLMNIYSDLLAQCRGLIGVEREENLSPEQFFRWYYAGNRPVILSGLMDGWNRWTPDYLRWRCGDETVEVMGGRDSDAQYEINCESHKVRMTMDQFVGMVESAGETNDFYMVANNRSNGAGPLRALLGEIPPLAGYLSPLKAAGDSVFFWFGPAGTRTPLHHDTMNILLAQVLGRKKITLIPSFETHLVYNHVGVYSQVDCENPDPERFPLFSKASKFETVLEPGEVLFIPVGWWHQVRSLDVSISVSFTNFVVPNAYKWTEAT